MRKGILGSLAAVAAGAGMAWGQTGPLPTSPSGKSFVGGEQIIPVLGGNNTPGPIIPPSLPVGGGEGGMIPQAGPIYPPPANFSGIDPDSLPQVPFHGFSTPEAPHFWFGADYLLWVSKSQPLRYPLVTTSNAASQGRLNNPTTTTLFTDSDISYNFSNGFRVNGGFFWDVDRRTGFELGGFLLQEKTKSFFVNSDSIGVPVIARPFFDVTTRTQSSIPIALPGQFSGQLGIETSTQTYSIEGNYLLNLYRSCPGGLWGVNLNFLAGLRYIQLEEILVVQSQSVLLPGAALPAAFSVLPGQFGGLGNASFSIVDNFRALNQFYGGQLGLQSEFRKGRWSLSGNYKVALGNMHSRVDVEGVTSATRGRLNPTTGSLRGGVLANAQNIGREHNDRFAVVPELNLVAGYNLTSHLTFTMGYNFLYLTNVIRPGEIAESRLNPGVIPASPSFGNAAGVLPRFNNLRETDFFVQGVSFGFLVRY
jgi:hypothetical protein